MIDEYLKYLGTCPACDGTGFFETSDVGNTDLRLNQQEIAPGTRIKCPACAGNGKDTQYVQWCCVNANRKCDPSDPDDECTWALRIPATAGTD